MHRDGFTWRLTDHAERQLYEFLYSQVHERPLRWLMKDLMLEAFEARQGRPRSIPVPQYTPAPAPAPEHRKALPVKGLLSDFSA